MLDVFSGEHMIRNTLRKFLKYDGVIRAMIVSCENSGDALKKGTPLFYRAWMEENVREITPIIQYMSEKQPVNSDVIRVLMSVLKGEYIEVGLEQVITGEYRDFMLASKAKILYVNLIGFHLNKKKFVDKVFILVLSLDRDLTEQLRFNILPNLSILKNDLKKELRDQFSYD